MHGGQTDRTERGETDEGVGRRRYSGALVGGRLRLRGRRKWRAEEARSLSCSRLVDRKMEVHTVRRGRVEEKRKEMEAEEERGRWPGILLLILEHS